MFLIYEEIPALFPLIINDLYFYIAPLPFCHYKYISHLKNKTIQTTIFMAHLPHK